MSAYLVSGQAYTPEPQDEGTLLTLDITVHLCDSPESAIHSVTVMYLQPFGYTWIAPPVVRAINEDYQAGTTANLNAPPEATI